MLLTKKSNPKLRRRLPKFITADWLQRQYACEGQVDKFRDEWPDGCEVSVANAKRAAEIGLQLNWLASTVVEYDLYWNESHRINSVHKRARTKAIQETALTGELYTRLEKLEVARRLKFGNFLLKVIGLK